MNLARRLTAGLVCCSITTTFVLLAHAQPQPSQQRPPQQPGASGWGIPPNIKADAAGSFEVGANTNTSTPAPATTPVATPTDPPPLPKPPEKSSSVKMTYEATQVDRAAQVEATKKSPDDSVILHGFRLGYGHVMNYEKALDSFDGKTLKETGMRSPHHFLIGYEVVYRVVSHSWLNVLLLGNGMIAGIEQSKFLPSGNLLIGAEINNSFQLGVGANLSPLKGSEAHVVAAAGWTPRVGSIYTPFHVYFIPDVDGVHRMGVTTGVTF